MMVWKTCMFSFFTSSLSLSGSSITAVEDFLDTDFLDFPEFLEDFLNVFCDSVLFLPFLEAVL